MKIYHNIEERRMVLKLKIRCELRNSKEFIILGNNLVLSLKCEIVSLP